MLYHKGHRTAALCLPRRGWRRGLCILGVYAPTSDSGIGERRIMRQNMDVLIQMVPATSLLLLAGDFNAELGNNQDTSIIGHDTVGPFGTHRLTSIGREWRPWFSRHSLRDIVSRYQGRTRHTWIHPRFQSEHELDHMLCKASDLWHLVNGRILCEGPSVTSPWSPDTDHNPVEVTLRFGKDWLNGSKNRVLKGGPSALSMEKEVAPSSNESSTKSIGTFGYTKKWQCRQVNPAQCRCTRTEAPGSGFVPTTRVPKKARETKGEVKAVKVRAKARKEKEVTSRSAAMPCYQAWTQTSMQPSSERMTAT